MLHNTSPRKRTEHRHVHVHTDRLSVSVSCFTTHHHANAQNTAMYTFTQTVCPFLYHAHGVKHVRTALIDTDPESPYPRSTTVLNLHGFRPGSGLG